ncbi:MAG TPA: hypothetical protein VI542_10045 [Candidatus Tectomicrobia bacterium]
MYRNITAPGNPLRIPRPTFLVKLVLPLPSGVILVWPSRVQAADVTPAQEPRPATPLAVKRARARTTARNT